MHIEILNWTVRASTGNPDTEARPKEPATRQMVPSRCTTIWCDVAGKPRDAALIDRAELAPGDCLDGPALVTEPQTTTFVGADFALCVDSAGNLVLTRNSAEAST
jgi:N-methylhydantoinase A